MINLYVATRVLTVFGTIMRAFWEQVACRLCGIPVEDVRAFKVSELCGHIEHELIKNKKHSFIICWLPFTLNFILSVCFLLSGAYRVIYVGDVKTITSWVFLWLGVSFAANCVPSFEDVLSFKENFYNSETKTIVKVLLAPFFAVVYGFSILERYSLTFVVAILFALVFPKIANMFFPLAITVSQMFN
ncbi:MAG: hypothetical protein UGF89_09670 [Acutalibacteraceae bacterium]|nr:hypothetical protein [Acutalibacteraceae bacterium]